MASSTAMRRTPGVSGSRRSPAQRRRVEPCGASEVSSSPAIRSWGSGCVAEGRGEPEAGAGRGRDHPLLRLVAFSKVPNEDSRYTLLVHRHEAEILEPPVSFLHAPDTIVM